jgi:hypothetical protein
MRFTVFFLVFSASLDTDAMKPGPAILFVAIWTPGPGGASGVPDREHIVFTVIFYLGDKRGFQGEQTTLGWIAHY